VSYVGVPHGVQLDGAQLFFTHVHLHGGPAPVRRYLPELINMVWSGTINPGKVFDLTLPLDQVAEAYRAMDDRRAIKALLLPGHQQDDNDRQAESRTTRDRGGRRPAQLPVS
jgi:threonine dehydrogenase-like Zn-dependent dehydrogenase